jgi:hypothetical protein
LEGYLEAEAIGALVVISIMVVLFVLGLLGII